MTFSKVTISTFANMNTYLKTTMKAWILFIVIIGFLIYIVAAGLGAEAKQSDDQKQKQDQFIKSCVDQGKRVNQIGDIFTGETLVCNPK